MTVLHDGAVRRGRGRPVGARYDAAKAAARRDAAEARAMMRVGFVDVGTAARCAAWTRGAAVYVAAHGRDRDLVDAVCTGVNGWVEVRLCNGWHTRRRNAGTVPEARAWVESVRVRYDGRYTRAVWRWLRGGGI